MFKLISKSLWLLLFAVIICCVIYPAVVWSIGQTLFPFQANGSMVGADSKPMAHPDDSAVGSLLIAHPLLGMNTFNPGRRPATTTLRRPHPRRGPPPIISCVIASPCSSGQS